MKATESQHCPCGREASYAECCELFHEGRAEAANAETLMRSRFSAFAKKRVGYLWNTLHKDHDEKGRDPNAFTTHLKNGLHGLVYKKLTVIDTLPPDHEGVARVLFYANVFQGNRDLSFMELSTFANDGTGWRYLFGMPVANDEIKGDIRAMSIKRVMAD